MYNYTIIRRIIQSLIIIAIFTIAGCITVGNAYHKYIMRGQILEVTDNEVYLCIGSNDGAKVGQELTVYKITGENSHIPGGRYHGRHMVFKREAVGKVKITEIVNEHYATAEVISGKAERNFIVELE